MPKTTFQVEINKISKLTNDNWNIYVDSNESVSFLYKSTLSFSWSVNSDFPETPVITKWNFGAATANIITKIIHYRAFQPIYWNMCTSLTQYISDLDKFLNKKTFEELEQIEICQKEKLVLDLFEASRSFSTFENNNTLPEFGINYKSTNSGIGYSTRKSDEQKIRSNYTHNTIKVLDKLWLYFDKIKNYHVLIKKILEKIVNEMSSIDFDLYHEETYLSNWLKKFNIKIKDTIESNQIKLVENFKNHFFINQKYNINPKFAKRILSEIKALKESLPNKLIYVTWSETKMNLLKALILPVEDTPYKNGYFEFDILLPNDYPNVPPKVQFMTTAGGTVRFNPNLYACGKVCLSLLGTWSGEPWIPKKSTILQVLISILAMIFVSNPYFNEPGYHSQEGTKLGQKKNEEYNLKIKKFTNLYANKIPEDFKWINLKV